MREIIASLPYPPSINTYYVHTRRGVRLAEKGKAYRETVESAIHEQGLALNIECPVCVQVVVYPPDHRRRDVDNTMKALLDALTHADVWGDDAQVDQLFIYRGVVVPKGKVLMTINESGLLIPSEPSLALKILE